MPEASLRLFFALWPDAAVADRLAGEAREAAARHGGRPTRRDTIHLTLAFLGNVASSRLDAVKAAARSVTARPFGLTLDRLGYWHHNHLLWAGCAHPPDELAKLAGDLQKALAGAGFAPDGIGREFVPHVTLVRRVPDGMSTDTSGIAAVEWPCDEFVLAVSETGGEGSKYRLAGRFPLGDS